MGVVERALKVGNGIYVRGRAERGRYEFTRIQASIAMYASARRIDLALIRRAAFSTFGTDQERKRERDAGDVRA